MYVPKADFSLNHDFIQQYAGKQPNWGPLGYLVYKRTYALTKDDGTTEEFWETCKRVIEGIYSIQKGHCNRYGLPWSDAKAQRSAQEAFTRMFEFKWLPPGRGLAKMGTETVFRKGGLALNNCAFLSTQNIGNKDVPNSFSEPFCTLMDMSMMGVGVGFDTKGAGTVSIINPKYEEKFVVQDSREGWVDYLRALLNCWVYPDSPYPVADYSLVRPKGSPIRGFGGTASGPESLELLTDRINRLLSKYVGRVVDSRAIVDIANSIGECVVSGGVRRTAEIAFGSPDDQEFLHLKNYKDNPEAKEWPRWASNNSFIVGTDTDFTEMAKLTATNGEPGYLFLENARKYGRTKDPANWLDKEAAGANPCYSGDTLVATADGRNAVTFKELAENGEDVPIYTLKDDGTVSIAWGLHPRKTRENAKLIRVHLDNGTYLDVTPDHKMILKNGGFKYAQELVKGDSLPRFPKRQEVVKKNGNKYWRIYTNTNNPRKGKIFEHRLIADFFHQGVKDELYDNTKQNGYIKGGVVVHHKDHDPLNNRPENLKWMTFEEHAYLHSKIASHGENNPMYGKKHRENTKEKIGAKSKERWKSEEFRKKQRAYLTPEVRKEFSERFSETRNKQIIEQHLEYEKNTHLDTVWIKDRLHVKKSCEICDTQFVVTWGKRQRIYCSQSCSQTYLTGLETRKENLRQSFESKQKQRLHDQITVFKDLQESLNRDPLQKEWAEACKAKGIPSRIRTGKAANDTTNPYVLKGFKELKQRAAEYNHRVTYIEELPGEHDVYDLGVDNTHNLAIIPAGTNTNDSYTGIFCSQCNEQTLDDGECCCLVETFPSNCDDYEDYQRTLKFAYLYAKTVTLVPTHIEKTNAVMLKNRRIGCSQSGIQDNIAKRGLREHLNWCDQGYDYICKLDEIYSDWLCIRQSIKKTSVKPSGSVSKLCNTREGIHESKGEYELQTVRLNANSPLLPALQQANYRIEDDLYVPNTKVVYFPMHYPRIRERNPTMWEQLELAALMQEYWADNQVSVTVDFDPTTEGPEIKRALEMYAHRLKGLSFLPRQDHGYAQAPKTVISKEEYEEYKKQLLPLDLSELATREVEDRFCDNGVCEVPQGNIEDAAE